MSPLRPLLPLLAVVSLLALTMPALAELPAASLPHPTATLTGPSLVAATSKSDYVLSASGGPAVASNGTITGNFTYNATIIGTNTTGGSVSPATGTFTNHSVVLALIAPNNTGSYSLMVEVKSTGTTGNSTYTNATAPFTVVIPYVVSTSIDNPNAYKIQGAIVQVNLDGSTLAEVTLPTIGANGTYAFAYNYTTLGLSSGYHTFTLSLHGTPGLLEFSNGQTTYSVTIYVTPPAPDYTFYIVGGVGLTAAAIFISLLVVGGRARKKSK